jgi:hypothetical protein
MAGQTFTATAASGVPTVTTGKGGTNVLTGITSWYLDNSTKKYYATYTLPVSGFQMVFEATPAQMDAIFGAGVRPMYTYSNFEAIVKPNNRVFAGSLAEMEGTGTFTDHYKRVLTIALDQGSLPAWAAGDKKVEELMFIEAAEDKGEDWLIEQYSQLPSFQARYPNLNAFKKLNMTTLEAVKAFQEYEAVLKELQRSVNQNENLVTPATVAAVFSRGYAASDLKAVYDTFQRMENNSDALSAFNSILVQQGKPALTPASAFQFMAGQAPQDFYEIYEAASFAEGAQNAGLGTLFNAADALRVAALTPGFTSLGDSYSIMSELAGTLLRFRGDIDFQRYGLTADDLMDLHFGVAPQSGASLADIEDNMRRAVAEAQDNMQRSRLKPFTGFTESGVAQQRSLTGYRKGV